MAEEESAAAPRAGGSELRGARIAWSEQGSGPLVVYAHGLTQSRASEAASGMFDWSPVTGGHRLVRYDARGHGESTGRPAPEEYTWPNLAEDMLALIEELSPSEPAAAIGSSMGTGTVLHAAIRSPGRFSRLVLTAPPTAWATRAAQAGMYTAGADLIEQHGADFFADMAAQAPVPAVFADLPHFPPAPDVDAALLPSVLRGAALSDLPGQSELATLQLPVLVLAWAGDPGHPVSTAEQLTAQIAGARLEVAETPAQLRAWGSISARFLDEKY